MVTLKNTMTVHAWTGQQVVEKPQSTRVSLRTRERPWDCGDRRVGTMGGSEVYYGWVFAVQIVISSLSHWDR